MLIFIYITGESVPNIMGMGIEVSRGEWVIRRRWVEILTYQSITEPPLCHIPLFRAKCVGRWYPHFIDTVRNSHIISHILMAPKAQVTMLQP